MAYTTSIHVFISQLFTRQNLDAHPLIRQLEHRLSEQEERVSDLENRLNQEKERTSEQKEENTVLRWEYSTSVSNLLEEDMQNYLRVEGERQVLERENKKLKEQILGLDEEIVRLKALVEELRDRIRQGSIGEWEVYDEEIDDWIDGWG